MTKEKLGSLTIFLGCNDTVMESMMFQGKLLKDKGYRVYIGCLEKLKQSSYSEFQSHIDSTIHFEHIYQNNPQIVLIDNFYLEVDQQIKIYGDIRTLLEKGYDVYTCINAEIFQIQNIQNKIFENLLISADHVIFLDEDKENERLYKLAKSKYLEWVKQKDLLVYRDERPFQEHILVCISPSPSCRKVIFKALDLALCSHSRITALYVSTLNRNEMNEDDQKQLQNNIDLAENLGIKVKIVYAEDEVKQIIEFAQLTGVSKIVIEKSIRSKGRLLKSQLISNQLASKLNSIEIYIVPVYESYHFKMKRENFHFIKKDFILSIIILAICTIIGFIFFKFGFNDSNIIMFYILGVFLIAILTASKIYSIIFSLISVLVFNFFFTFPRLSLSVYETGYPITFLIMFIVAFMTSHLAARIQRNAKFSSNIAERTKILLETNQMLQKEISKEGIIKKSCEQLHKLLNRDIIFYSVNNDELGELFVLPNQNQSHIDECFSSNEIGVAKWVITHNKHGGASTRYLPSGKYLYLAVQINKKVYGVVGIYLNKDRLDSFENDMLLAILGEIAFALEIEKVIYEKNKADLKAKNEQLLADLLRSISHDLRTPLTSISGNADILMANDNLLSKENKQKLYADIYDDSLWLINLVENLLSITRIEDKTIQLKIEPQVIEEIILEALEHVSRKKSEHHIHLQLDDELLIADIDARLIIQVIINIVDNAIKYTPKESNITIHSYYKRSMVYVEIWDDGPGIPDDEKQKVFDKFYSRNNNIVDGKRSMGLGLALCKSIINAHGGSIDIFDCNPHGSLFRFTLPATKINYM